MTACAVPECEKPVWRRDWCRAHYKRWLKYGSPTAGGPMRSRDSLEARFWQSVARGDGCWEWQGSLGSHGYGQITLGRHGRKQVLTAHRVSWELNVGPITDGLWVLHHCDNKRCVRPDHLYLGTVSDNTRDAWARGQRKR